MDVRQLFDLSGRVAMVSGGGRGLGEQMARALAEAGADVMICSRKLDACESVAATISTETGRRCLARSLNVADPQSVKEVANAALSAFARVDILVNNAGISWGAPVLEMPVDKWNQVLTVNATGSFLLAQALAPGMLAAGYGRIINIASVAGLLGMYEDVMSATGYHASKGAVIAMTRDLAVKWAHRGVTVNAIAPGFFPSRMSQGLLAQAGEKILSATPMRRYGSDEDLKGLVVYLASQASSYMTGQVLVIDGGASAI